MIRLEPKYTYSAESGIIWQPYVTADSGYTLSPTYQLYPTSNWVPFPATPLPVNASGWEKGIVTPNVTMPVLGTKHNERVGDRIRVTKLRLKMLLTMDSWLCTRIEGNPFNNIPYDRTSNPTGVVEQYNYDNSESNAVKRWFKFRFFIVEFSKSLTLSPAKLYQWFQETFCPFMEENTLQIQSYKDRPISVHSNVLRMSTDWTGEFNILCDRCFTWYNNKPQFSLDLTIPINREYKFREGTDELLSPNIVCFLLPPLNLISDMDPLSRAQYQLAWTGTGHPSIAPDDTPDHAPNEFYRVDVWTKLSYTDL